VTQLYVAKYISKSTGLLLRPLLACCANTCTMLVDHPKEMSRKHHRKDQISLHN
jgi:hypothetical protein